MDAARTLIREPDVANAGQYRRRVRLLAAIHLGAFLFTVCGIALLIRYGRLFVSLSQRSNVETLTILFFLVFFAYIALLSCRGAWGALRLAGYWVIGSVTRDRAGAERRKIARLHARRSPGPAVALNRGLVRGDQPGQPFRIEVADDLGTVGTLEIDGVKIRHREALGKGSNDLLAFFVRQVSDVLGIDPDALEVVSWASIDEEGWHEYVGLVEALNNLGARMADRTGQPSDAAQPVWPSLVLSPAQCAELQTRLAAVCGAVRSEAFLPQMEFEGEHKIPIIPEPLGIISLARRERRVDPLSSMGSSFLMIAVVVAVLVLLIVRPPWVPAS